MSKIPDAGSSTCAPLPTSHNQTLHRSKRTKLRLDRNGDHCWSVGAQRLRECSLYLFARPWRCTRASIAFRQIRDVDARNIESRNIRRLLQVGERLQDRILAVAGDDEDDLQ